MPLYIMAICSMVRRASRSCRLSARMWASSAFACQKLGSSWLAKLGERSNGPLVAQVRLLPDTGKSVARPWKRRPSFCSTATFRRRRRHHSQARSLPVSPGSVPRPARRPRFGRVFSDSAPEGRRLTGAASFERERPSAGTDRLRGRARPCWTTHRPDRSTSSEHPRACATARRRFARTPGVAGWQACGEGTVPPPRAASSHRCAAGATWNLHSNKRAGWKVLRYASSITGR